MNGLKYRPDIDGLRAVAVLGVVIYHAFPWLIPGGFIGVDIFFVISGYLISAILYKGLRGGNFSFAEFYARRVKRLFPALITMLVLSFFLGYRLLLVNEFQELGKQVAAGTLFLQNFLFWQESGYFDRVAELKPLLHLWSLAVEEQFYLIFPLLLILLWKRSLWLVPVLAVLCACSLFANCIMAIQNRDSDFYMIPYRAWEFLGGSLLARWHYDRQHDGEALPYRNIMSFAGLILLLLAMGRIHSEAPYPGWRALFPVGGSLLLIEAGREAWVNRWVLSNPVIIWIGLISYPLYLFHWPALSFTRICFGAALDVRTTLMALGIAMLLTVATYYLIERRVRFSASRWTVSWLIILFISLGVTGVFCAAGWIYPRSSSFGFDAVVRASKDNDYFKGYARKMDKSFYSISRAGGSGPKTLFIGDSHMEECAPRILEILRSGKAGDRGAVFVTRGGSPPIPGVVNTLKDSGKGFTRKILELGLSPDVDRVVIAANWFYYFNWGGDVTKYEDHPLLSEEGTENALASLSKMINSLTREGKKVYLILGFPTSLEVDPLAIVKRSLMGNFSIKSFHFYVRDFLAANGRMNFSQEQLTKKIEAIATASGAKTINPVDFLQKDGEFGWHDDCLPYFYDGCHFSASFMREWAIFLDNVILVKEPSDQ